MSRLRPPPEHSGLLKMVWGKRQHYERLFYAAAVPHASTKDAELWVAEEVADFVEGMRPCYAKAAAARKRATGQLTVAAESKDPLFALIAKQMLADPSCLASPY